MRGWAERGGEEAQGSGCMVPPPQINVHEGGRTTEGGREGTAVMRLKITDEGLKVRASEVKAMRCFVLLLNSFLKGAKKRSW